MRGLMGEKKKPSAATRFVLYFSLIFTFCQLLYNFLSLSASNWNKASEKFYFFYLLGLVQYLTYLLWYLTLFSIVFYTFSHSRIYIYCVLVHPALSYFTTHNTVSYCMLLYCDFFTVLMLTAAVNGWLPLLSGTIKYLILS